MFTQKELEKIRTQLVLLKKQLLGAYDATASEVKAPDEAKGSSQHHADEGTDDFGRTISIEITSRGTAIIKQIDRAIEKIDEGTYGVCDISHDEIPKKRLEAIPYATMTRDAQEKYEKGLI